jgi:hypothetical protein
MPGKEFEVEKIMDSLATISSIIFNRLKCMECNKCEPCGVEFMDALKVLRGAGNPTISGGLKGGGGIENR